MNDPVQQILTNASRSEELAAEFRIPLVQRYKRFVLSSASITKSPQIDRLLARLNAIQYILAAIGAALGFFLIYAKVETKLQLIIWISYVIVASFVGYTLSIIPTDLRVFNSELIKLRLLNVCERLAAQVALFDLLYKDSTTESDDQDIIAKFSNFLPSLENLTRNDQAIIKQCLDPSYIYKSSRQTNIELPPLKIEQNIQEKLTAAVEEVVTLCEHLFVGSDFSAKLYLRARLEVEEGSAELLVPFSKYPVPANQSRGSAWVKARGNLSIVWEALETGRPKQVKQEGMGKYYSAVLAIPLPGRIGVLAITSKEENAFTDKDDAISTKALAVAMRSHVLQTLPM